MEESRNSPYLPDAYRVILFPKRNGALTIPETLEQGKKIHEEYEAKPLFRSVSGLNICNVDFSGCNLIDWDQAFRSIIQYYEYDG